MSDENGTSRQDEELERALVLRSIATSLQLVDGQIHTLATRGEQTKELDRRIGDLSLGEAQSLMEENLSFDTMMHAALARLDAFMVTAVYVPFVVVIAAVCWQLKLALTGDREDEQTPSKLKSDEIAREQERALAVRAATIVPSVAEEPPVEQASAKPEDPEEIEPADDVRDEALMDLPDEDEDETAASDQVGMDLRVSERLIQIASVLKERGDWPEVLKATIGPDLSDTDAGAPRSLASHLQEALDGDLGEYAPADLAGEFEAVPSTGRPLTLGDLDFTIARMREKYEELHPRTESSQATQQTVDVFAAVHPL